MDDKGQWWSEKVLHYHSPTGILILSVWAGKTVGGFCRPFLTVQKMLRKCLQRLGLCYQWQGKSVRKRFNTQSSIFQVYVTGIILVSAFSFSPTFLFLNHIKVALDLNIYYMKTFPQLKRVVLPFLLMVYRIKALFRLVETPPVMGSLELSPVPHSVREGRRLLVIPSRFWGN